MYIDETTIKFNRRRGETGPISRGDTYVVREQTFL